MRSRRWSAVSGIQRSSTPRSAREDVPRHDVGVVLEVAEHDDVARLQVGARPRVRDEVDRLGGVAREHDLARLACAWTKPGDLAARGLERRGGLFGDRVHAAVHVRVRLAVDAVHRVEDRLRLLRRRRGVEVHEPLAVDLPLQDREVGLDAGDVEGCGALMLSRSRPSGRAAQLRPRSLAARSRRHLRCAGCRSPRPRAARPAPDRHSPRRGRRAARGRGRG